MTKRPVASIALFAALAAASLTGACSPRSLVDVQPPDNFVDPAVIKTVEGAIQLRNAALAGMTRPLAGNMPDDVISGGGLFTDELTDALITTQGTDRRRLINATGSVVGSGLYVFINRARVRVHVAREALRLYAAGAPSAPSAWQGELYALEGYTVLWLAEFMCSGVPLSVISIDQPAQPTAGLTSEELYTRAVALFDSALVAGADSVRFVNLARVGKGRALLGLGQFAAADQAVRDVPTDFVYSVRFTETPGSDYNNNFGILSMYLRVQDNEGHNGMVWSTDPRTGIVVDSDNSNMLRPSKYNVTGGQFTPTTENPGAAVRLADGLEARLIQAEAALSAGDATWLTTLNTLRATCIGPAVCAPVPGITASNLPDTLSDPGSQTARENLLFKERAMWLYLTGHREGDLRRLAHIYHRDPSTLWPTGVVVSPAFPPLYSNPPAENGQLYGNDVVFRPDASEQNFNPLYDGCYDFNP